MAARRLPMRTTIPPQNVLGPSFDVTDLGDGLHLVVNGGGNVLVSNNADGILVIDTGMAFRAKDYLAAMETLAPQCQAQNRL